MPRVSRSNPHSKDTAQAVPALKKMPLRKKVTEADPESPSSKGQKVAAKVNQYEHVLWRENLAGRVVRQ